jgi:mRNA interferase MazF
MTPYKRGDVVLVPFPFSDQSSIKKRPAVIISSDKYNGLSSDVVIMAITSREEYVAETGEFRIADWQGAGLLKPSVVKSAISTIEHRLVLRKMGSLLSKDLSSLNQSLRVLLSL